MAQSTKFRILSGDQADDPRQGVIDQPHPAPDPAHGAGKLDRVAAQLVRRRGQAGRALGNGHHRFQRIQRARQPGRQTVGQQAEGRVGLRAVPASDPHTPRRLALIRAVPCQRAAAARMVRAPLKPCIAPCPGGNVLLAGKPRLIAKLHRPWARRGMARASPPSPVQTEPKTTDTAPGGEAVDASCGPIGVLRPVWSARGQAGACPRADHTRRSRAHRSTAATTAKMIPGMKRFAAAAGVPTLLRHPGKSGNGRIRLKTLPI